MRISSPQSRWDTGDGLVEEEVVGRFFDHGQAPDWTLPLGCVGSVAEQGGRLLPPGVTPRRWLWSSSIIYLQPVNQNTVNGTPAVTSVNGLANRTRTVTVNIRPPGRFWTSRANLAFGFA